MHRMQQRAVFTGGGFQLYDVSQPGHSRSAHRRVLRRQRRLLRGEQHCHRGVTMHRRLVLPRRRLRGHQRLDNADGVCARHRFVDGGGEQRHNMRELQSRYIQRHIWVAHLRELCAWSDLRNWRYVVRHAVRAPDGARVLRRHLHLQQRQHHVGVRLRQLCVKLGRQQRLGGRQQHVHGLWAGNREHRLGDIFRCSRSWRLRGDKHRHQKRNLRCDGRRRHGSFRRL